MFEDETATIRDLDDRMDEYLADEVDRRIAEWLDQVAHDDITAVNERLEDVEERLRVALARVDAITPCPCQTSVYVALPLRDDERPTG
jgi:hypothetical protein